MRTLSIFLSLFVSFLVVQLLVFMVSGIYGTDVYVILEILYIVFASVLTIIFLVFHAVISLITLRFGSAANDLINALDLILYLLLLVLQGSITIIAKIFLSPVKLLVLLINSETLTKLYDSLESTLLNLIGTVTLKISSDMVYSLIETATGIDPRLPVSLTAGIGLSVGGTGGSFVVIRRGSEKIRVE